MTTPASDTVSPHAPQPVGRPAEALWSPLDLLPALNARVVNALPERVTGISIDTRTLMPGDLFFAIRGDNSDGHAYVSQALAKGAAAAVIDEAHAASRVNDGPLYIVRDVLESLESLGKAARARTRGKIVAVTGSVGKTSTKEALRLALEGQGLTHASVASYNNHWGVPLSLARMPRRARFGIFEVGMNAPDEIRPLTRLVRPHVAIVTTVGQSHLERFPSVDAIADAKGEVFAGLEPGGVAVLNRDNEHFERLKAHAQASHAGRIITFGLHPEADIHAVKIVAMPELSVVEAQVFGTPVVYRLGSPGRHVALNSLAVLAAVHAVGADLALAALALGNLTPPVGRGERVRLSAPGGEFLLIDESYNANPTSMKAALDTLGQAAAGLRGRRIAVLADMLELGPDSDAMHARLNEPIVENDIDLVFAAGPGMHHLWRALAPEVRGAYAETAQGLEEQVLRAVRAGDAVMVKGSNGTRVSRIVAAIRSRFPAVGVEA
ncbi:UDP-N-acetylmuramoylalanyl-D-glutamyl-2,6-diaminopimelate--D-alanyl-D-alanine ligase [Pseudochelatococcus contaminans]|uniref:UDP-N-acetylmuramoyl-tripeptide--D-alanyl-D-alanine ligase n=1 Tax=Pseudochelatococcus contaminans TaxID=1538103 RepID=A0A7W5Z1D2_9HYPH|nr:UDP-N-acetylmuramoylalanyl-D-glutamyl-2,6-diaminopimelate--D-alanyl-D-alanine ligase [Pseudochelatococcus contaminans]MBB3808253.1 UDP-N-acetylmuramoyl-tripeptide--D-alanyl-D-alanine ligase [Pseudochelatococcus contaminans]